MAADTIPVSPLSIWKPIHLGTDELGHRVEVTLAERNMLIGGEPGGGKSVALQLIVAHGALSADCRLILVDGKRVELGLWRDCADRFIGPSIDDAIDTLHWLQDQIDERTEWLLDHKMRKITPDLGWPVYLMPVDEVAYFSATVGTTGPAEGVQRLQPRHRRPRPGTGHHPGRSHPAALRRHHPHLLRDLFGYRWAFRCSTEASCDTILGHGWANMGYSATEIDPQARGVGWLRAEDGIPRRVKAAYLTDQQIIDLAGWAAQARADPPRQLIAGGPAATWSGCTEK